MKNIEKLLDSRPETYIYCKDVARYYWIEKKKFFNGPDVCSNLMITPAKLKERRIKGKIPSYDGMCYLQGGKKYHYNLLDERDILLPSDTPEIDENIQALISSIGGYQEENIEYLHKSILYKYSHVNDYSLPAIVFYGVGGSGKSSFVTLLSTIFGESNVMGNLGQRDIGGSFDTYKGKKLIIEFAEITTNNTHSDIKILNKLKNIIGAEKITINEKGIQAYQIENIAWFLISSNSNTPIQLDDKDKGNRRFTVMRSKKKLENGKEINEAIRDPKKVANYLAWLIITYPEVLDYTSLTALDNQDKRDLEEMSQNEANSFWDWLSENYPDFKGKKQMIDIRAKLDEYILQADIPDTYNFEKFFWKNSKYPKKKIRIGEKTYTGVNIE